MTEIYVPERPIYSKPRFLPGSIVDGSSLDDVLLADGCRVDQAEITNSVIGLRSQISSGVIIKDSILMGADYYDPHSLNGGEVPLGIGERSEITGAILDKNIRIGPGVNIQPFPKGTDLEKENWAVRDGIVVIPKNTVLPAGTYIGPDQ